MMLRPRIRFRWICVIAVLVISSTPLGPFDQDHAAGDSERLIYEGWLGPRRDSDRIRLSVTFEDGRPVGGRVRASRVFLSCEEGSRRVSFRTIKLHFHRGGSFEAEGYGAGSSGGPERYVRLEGGFVERSRRANGIFFAFMDPPDDDPDRACGTFSLVAWKALLRR
jgi:hypothetical protein